MSEATNAAPVQAPITAPTASNATDSKTQAQIDYEMMIPVKIDKQEVQKPLKEILKDYQINTVGYKRMEEAARIVKEHQEKESLFTKNPEEALRKFGLNPEEFAEQLLAKKIKFSQLSDGEKRALELEQKVKDYEAREQERKQQEETQKLEQLTAQYRDKIQSEMLASLESHPTLPKSLETVAEIAKVQAAWADKGVDLSTDQCASIVEQRMVQRFNSILTGMSGEQIIKLFSDSLLNKVRKIDLHRLSTKVPVAHNNSSILSQAGKNIPKEKKPMNLDEVFENARKNIR